MNHARIERLQGTAADLAGTAAGGREPVGRCRPEEEPLRGQRRPVEHADPHGRHRQRQLRAGVHPQPDGERGRTLEKIEASLERIEEGTYGTCEECGVKIPKTRLNAIPYATLCVKCASQQEQRPRRRHEGGSAQPVRRVLCHRRGRLRRRSGDQDVDVRLARDARPRRPAVVALDGRGRLPDQPQRRAPCSAWDRGWCRCLPCCRCWRALGILWWLFWAGAARRVDSSPSPWAASRPASSATSTTAWACRAWSGTVPAAAPRRPARARRPRLDPGDDRHLALADVQRGRQHVGLRRGLARLARLLDGRRRPKPKPDGLARAPRERFGVRRGHHACMVVAALRRHRAELVNP